MTCHLPSVIRSRCRYRRRHAASLVEQNEIIFSYWLISCLSGHAACGELAHAEPCGWLRDYTYKPPKMANPISSFTTLPIPTLGSCIRQWLPKNTQPQRIFVLM